MGLRVRCSKCRRFNPADAESCRCGNRFNRPGGEVYCLDFRKRGKRYRPSIGRFESIEEARKRAEEVKPLFFSAEGQIEVGRNLATIGELITWHLGRAEVQKLNSYLRKKQALANIEKFFGPNFPIASLSFRLLKDYQERRLRDPVRRGQNNGRNCNGKPGNHGTSSHS